MSIYESDIFLIKWKYWNVLSRPSTFFVFSDTKSIFTFVYVFYERAFMNITNLFCKNILITDHDELWIILDWDHTLFFQKPQ